MMTSVLFGAASPAAGMRDQTGKGGTSKTSLTPGIFILYSPASARTGSRIISRDLENFSLSYLSLGFYVPIDAIPSHITILKILDRSRDFRRNVSTTHYCAAAISVNLRQECEWKCE